MCVSTHTLIQVHHAILYDDTTSKFPHLVNITSLILPNLAAVITRKSGEVMVNEHGSGVLTKEGTR